MKKCPKCGQTYSEKDLNFCYNDGELLNYLADDAPTQMYEDRPSFSYADDPPPTEVLRPSRITSETKWPQQPAPPAVWQPDTQGAGALLNHLPTQVSPTQTLAVISLGLGAASVTIGWCCSTGWLFAPAAMITGFIALSQIKKDPNRYTGRGFAIGGIITAAIFLAVYLVIIILYVLAMLAGSLAG